MGARWQTWLVLVYRIVILGLIVYEAAGREEVRFELLTFYGGLLGIPEVMRAMRP